MSASLKFSPQITASLDHLVGVASGENPEALLDLLEGTSEGRLRDLLAASITRFNIRKNSPNETDRERRDLRESLIAEMDRQILILQLEAKDDKSDGQIIDSDAKSNKAYGIRIATGIVRESSHLFS